MATEELVLEGGSAQSEISTEELASDVFARVLGRKVPKETLEEQGIIASRLDHTKEVSGYLQEIADRLDKDIDDQLDGLIDQLHLDETTVYDTFKAVASEIFRSGVTWGRVAVLFMFGAKLALKTFIDTGKLFNSLVSWVAKYVTEQLMAWITAGGGWTSVGTFLMEKFTDVLTKDDPDGPGSGALALNKSNIKWLVVGIGIGVAIAGWAYSQK